ncbi:MAG: T9SS type A sorting domain-containing protein [Bacteroidetes bacterium]|nr:T9SS type A sorting domain-containing protein [Bacteroidota bacterium]
MYRYIISLILLGFSSRVMAISGDTTVVVTHNRVLIQTDPSRGSTRYFSWSQFPKNKTYRKVYADLTFECPSDPKLTCGEWDYLNYVHLHKRRGKHNDSLNWEIMRFITPYGHYFPKGWNFTWRYDITDLATLLEDSVELYYTHTGYEAKNDRGWVMSLKFTFIEGTPVRPIENIQRFYTKSVGYGNDSLFDANVPEIQYKTGPKTTEVRYKILQTGHGMDKPENCAEFCAKQRYLRHDGQVIDTSWVWRDNCGSNPLFPQYGTWLYDRAGWCPGSSVQEFNKNVWVSPESTHTMDLDMQSYKTSNGGANYMITTYLVEYGPRNFSTDAELYDVSAPSNRQEYGRLNPICGGPVISVKNNGKEAVTRLFLEYGFAGKLQQRYVWTGTLQRDEIRSLELPALKEWPTTDTLFEARILAVNGMNDDCPENNYIASKTAGKVAELPSQIMILFRSNNAPGENYFTLKKSDGTVIMDKKNFAANTTYKEYANLDTGCYQFTFMDDGTPPSNNPLPKDGLYFWANTDDGTGILQIRNAGNSIIKTFDADFGTGIWYQFRVGNLPDTKEPVTRLTCYPNPAKHDLLIDLGKDRNDNIPLHILIYNTAGQKVLEQKRTGILDALQYLDLTPLQGNGDNGLYFLTLTLGEEKYQSKIMVR